MEEFEFELSSIEGDFFKKTAKGKALAVFCVPRELAK